MPTLSLSLYPISNISFLCSHPNFPPRDIQVARKRIHCKPGGKSSATTTTTTTTGKLASASNNNKLESSQPATCQQLSIVSSGVSEAKHLREYCPTPSEHIGAPPLQLSGANKALAHAVGGAKFTTSSSTTTRELAASAEPVGAISAQKRSQNVCTEMDNLACVGGDGPGSRGQVNGDDAPVAKRGNCSAPLLSGSKQTTSQACCSLRPSDTHLAGYNSCGGGGEQSPGRPAVTNHRECAATNSIGAHSSGQYASGEVARTTTGTATKTTTLAAALTADNNNNRIMSCGQKHVPVPGSEFRVNSRGGGDMQANGAVKEHACPPNNTRSEVEQQKVVGGGSGGNETNGTLSSTGTARLQGADQLTTVVVGSTRRKSALARSGRVVGEESSSEIGACGGGGGSHLESLQLSKGEGDDEAAKLVSLANNKSNEATSGKRQVVGAKQVAPVTTLPLLAHLHGHSSMELVRVSSDDSPGAEVGVPLPSEAPADCQLPIGQQREEEEAEEEAQQHLRSSSTNSLSESQCHCCCCDLATTSDDGDGDEDNDETECEHEQAAVVAMDKEHEPQPTGQAEDQADGGGGDTLVACQSPGGLSAPSCWRTTNGINHSECQELLAFQGAPPKEAGLCSTTGMECCSQKTMASSNRLSGVMFVDDKFSKPEARSAGRLSHIRQERDQSSTAAPTTAPAPQHSFAEGDHDDNHNNRNYMDDERDKQVDGNGSGGADKLLEADKILSLQRGILATNWTSNCSLSDRSKAAAAAAASSGQSPWQSKFCKVQPALEKRQQKDQQRLMSLSVSSGLSVVSMSSASPSPSPPSMGSSSTSSNRSMLAAAAAAELDNSQGFLEQQRQLQAIELDSLSKFVHYNSELNAAKSYAAATAATTGSDNSEQVPSSLGLKCLNKTTCHKIKPTGVASESADSQLIGRHLELELERRLGSASDRLKPTVAIDSSSVQEDELATATNKFRSICDDRNAHSSSDPPAKRQAVNLSIGGGDGGGGRGSSSGYHQFLIATGGDNQRVSMASAVSNKSVSSAQSTSRSLDIKRRFRALGQLVSFVQTSRQFNSSSSAPTSQSGDDDDDDSQDGDSDANTTDNNTPAGHAGHSSFSEHDSCKQTGSSVVVVDGAEAANSGVVIQVDSLSGGQSSAKINGPLPPSSGLPAANFYRLDKTSSGSSGDAAAAANQLRLQAPIDKRELHLQQHQQHQHHQHHQLNCNDVSSGTGGSHSTSAREAPSGGGASDGGGRADKHKLVLSLPVRQQTRRQNMEMKREKKAAKTLAIITGVFVCCWLPFFLNAIIMPVCGLACTPTDLVLSVLLWLGYLNSLLNPIIYTIFSPDFRLAFRRLLCWPASMRSGGGRHALVGGGSKSAGTARAKRRSYRTAYRNSLTCQHRQTITTTTTTTTTTSMTTSSDKLARSLA